VLSIEAREKREFFTLSAKRYARRGHVGYTKLVLFDIDGTIMDTDGAGQQSFVTALNTVFDRAFSVEGYSTSGKTDTQIAIELGERSDVSEAEMIDRLDEVRELYLSGLKVELAGITPTVFTGVRELVSSVSEHSGCVTGLLTGNFEPGAWMKLDRIDLTEPFQMGSFGDGARARKDLPGKAVMRARELTEQDFEGKDIVVIGDTPNDVACGRHLGVKSIAVATGIFGEAELDKAQPDHLFADFSDPKRVLDAILE
jgi:phosphoglycolate phosphatase-like HAD superfamily hydrolase